MMSISSPYNSSNFSFHTLDASHLTGEKKSDAERRASAAEFAKIFIEDAYTRNLDAAADKEEEQFPYQQLRVQAMLNGVEFDEITDPIDEAMEVYGKRS